MVDNIEDVDVVVGMMAEFVRPHGFAISETQLQVFILNASRRLFSDRFFTSSSGRNFTALSAFSGSTTTVRTEVDGKGNAQRTSNPDLATETGPAAHDSRAKARARSGRECLRSMGAGSGRVLLVTMEAPVGSGVGPGIRAVNDPVAETVCKAPRSIRVSWCLVSEVRASEDSLVRTLLRGSENPSSSRKANLLLICSIWPADSY